MFFNSNLKYRVEQLEKQSEKLEKMYALKWVEKVMIWIGGTAGTAAIGILVAQFSGLLEMLV